MKLTVRYHIYYHVVIIASGNEVVTCVFQLNFSLKMCLKL